jgi:hypothetical protein
MQATLAGQQSVCCWSSEASFAESSATEEDGRLINFFTNRIGRTAGGW